MAKNALRSPMILNVFVLRAIRWCGYLEIMAPANIGIAIEKKAAEIESVISRLGSERRL